MMEGVKWRLLIWAAAVIAVVGAVGLSLDAAVAGLKQASGVAAVIAGFCELAAFLLGVAGWAGKRRGVSTGGDIPDAAAARTLPDDVGPKASTETGKRAKYVVDARDVGVLQVGDRNIQRNDFRRASPDRQQSGGTDER